MRLLLVVGVLALMVLACGGTASVPSTRTPSKVTAVPERASAPVTLAPSTPDNTPTQAVRNSAPVAGTGPTANKNANLRAGPGTGYAIVGSAAANDSLDIVGANQAGDWYQLASGAWIAAFLVTNAPPGLPVALAPTLAATVPTASSAPAGPATIGDLSLVVITNTGQNEILEVRNTGRSEIDISGWELRGSIGDDFCIIPGGTVLQPGEGFQVATGDSQVTARGFKCGDKPIWNNEGETIFLKAPDGQRIQIGS